MLGQGGGVLVSSTVTPSIGVLEGNFDSGDFYSLTSDVTPSISQREAVLLKRPYAINPYEENALNIEVQHNLHFLLHRQKIRLKVQCWSPSACPRFHALPPS